jgi:hypothetical protein
MLAGVICLGQQFAAIEDVPELAEVGADGVKGTLRVARVRVLTAGGDFLYTFLRHRGFLFPLM